MMNDRDVLRNLERHLQVAPKGVVYLEGKDDIPMLFALLGATAPDGPVFVHEGLGVVRFNEQDPSGGTSVRRHVEFASRKEIAGVYGMIDGDGAPLCELCSAFDEPFAGPLFRWKGYCLENLIAQSGWPPAWGEEPDWPATLRAYAAYVGLNRLHRELGAALKTLHLDRLQSPDGGRGLRTTEDVAAMLEQDKHVAAAGGAPEIRSFWVRLTALR